MTAKKTKPAKHSGVFDEGSTWNKLVGAVIAPLVISAFMSLGTYISFKSTVTVKLDDISSSVKSIQDTMMPRHEIERSIEVLTNRISDDEHSLEDLRRQVHDDEMVRRK